MLFRFMKSLTLKSSYILPSLVISFVFQFIHKHIPCTWIYRINLCIHLRSARLYPCHSLYAFYTPHLLDHISPVCHVTFSTILSTSEYITVIICTLLSTPVCHLWHSLLSSHVTMLFVCSCYPLHVTVIIYKSWYHLFVTLCTLLPPPVWHCHLL